MTSSSLEGALAVHAVRTLAVDSHVELLRNLRESVAAIGLDCLSQCLRSGPASNSEGEKLLSLLKELVGTQTFLDGVGRKGMQSKGSDHSDLSTPDDEYGYTDYGNEGEYNDGYGVYEELSYSDSDDEEDDELRIEDLVPQSRADEPRIEDTGPQSRAGEPRIEDTGPRLRVGVPQIENPVPRSRTLRDYVPISKSFYKELFPRRVCTPKLNTPGSFPDIDDFDGGIHEVGSGFSGLVFKSVLNGAPVVLKVSKKRGAAANRADYREWSVSERLKAHPNVVRVIGLCPSFRHERHNNVGTTAIVSPLMENGGLREFYDKPTNGSLEEDLRNAALGMIYGIRSLHEQRAVHRDIAVRNFLVDNDGRVLLCDFGLTEFIPDGDTYLHAGNLSHNSPVPWRHLAPESFRRIFSTKSDIWMYGLALIELVTNTRPWDQFENARELRRAMLAKELELPSMVGFPAVIAEIVRECLQFEPSDRPTADDIVVKLVKHEFDKHNSRDENGNTALHRAAANGDLNEELKKRHMTNAVNNFGETPLMLAKNEQVQKILLAYRPLPPGNKEPIAGDNMEYRHNTNVFWSLLKLAQKEDVVGIKSLGRLKLDVFAKGVPQKCGPGGETPLHIAAETGNAALIDAMMALEIVDAFEVNSGGQTALHVASACGHAHVIQKLIRGVSESIEAKHDLEANIDPHALVNVKDTSGKTALHLAAANSHASAVEILLNYSKTNVNLQDENKQSPIFESILGSSRSNAVLRTFVKHPSVDVNVKDMKGETILHKIAGKDFVEAAEIVFQRADLNVSARETEHGFTPLHVASRNLSVGVVRVLLSSINTNINELDKFDNTPLHILAKVSALSESTDSEQSSEKRERGRSIVNLLLSSKYVEVNRAGAQERTPLHEAAGCNNLIVAEALLARPEINADARDRMERTPFHCASRNNCVDVARVLLERVDVDLNTRDKLKNTLLHAAAYGNSVAIAEMLLSIERNSQDVDVVARDYKGQTPLHTATQRNSNEVAKFLLSRDDVVADAKDDDQATPLHLAALGNNLEVAKMLLLRDDVDASAVSDIGRMFGQTPLLCAADGGSVEIARLLFSKAEVDINAKDCLGETALHKVASTNSVDFAELLLSEEDIDAESRDDDEATPLHIAALFDSVDVSRLLMSRSDVDVNAREDSLYTPLHQAALTVHSKGCDTAMLLLSRDDIDANAVSEDGETPLHFAALFGKTQYVKALLARDDVVVNPRDKKRRTPLHVAALKNHVEAVKALLAHDSIDADAQDANGKTAIDIAEENNATECFELLQSYSSCATISLLSLL